MKKKSEKEIKNEKKPKLELNKNLTEEEKKALIIAKQKQYVEDMAKKRNFDMEFQKNENIKKQRLRNNKITKAEKIYMLISLFLIIFLFLAATYLSNPAKFSLKNAFTNKKLEDKKKGYAPEEERIAKINERLRKRKEEFNNLILNQDKPMPFPAKFEVSEFIDSLKVDKLIIPEIDEVKDNYIFIGDTYLKVEDLSVIFKDKYLAGKQKAEIKELIDLDEEKPNIIIARKYGLYTKDGELIVNIAGGTPQNFDGFVDKNQNPIVIAYDKTDGDLTDQMTFTPELKNLEDGKTYTLTYSVTNSKGEVSNREFKIKCVNIMKNLQK